LKKITVALAGCVLSVALVASSATGASGRSTLAGSTPSWAKSGNLKGAAATTDPVNFRVYLALRNQAQAESLARAMYTRGSSSYHKFLTPAQFDSQFAPSATDVASVKSWLQSQGLTVDYTPSNNHYVAAEGTVAQVQTAFQTKLNLYSVRGKSLRAPASDLSVPSTLAGKVAGVMGIDQSAALVRPNVIKSDAPPEAGFRNARPCSSYYGEKTTANTQVTDPTSAYSPATLPDYKAPGESTASPKPFAPCGYVGAQLQSVYGVSNAIASGYNGHGVTVAIIDAYASPTIVHDSSTYFANHGLPAWQSGQFSQIVAPGTYHRPENPRQDPQGWYGEETLDVEAVHTMAPGARVVYVSAPNNYQDLDAAMNHVVANRTADIVTNSYGWNTELLPFGYIKPFEDTLLQGALEGIGIYFSSGDDGDETFGGPAQTATPDWPATSPWVTAVGGTSLGVGASNNYLFETGWGTTRNRLNCTGFLKVVNSWCGNEVYLYGSGGGTSRLFGEPWYQAGVVPSSLATRWSSTPARVIPDISAVGDPNTGMLIGETQTFSTGPSYDEYRIGGTSLSSPLMAGIVAVAEQMKGSPIGFANPAIYGLSSGVFHDVTHIPGAVIRADYANSEDASAGILFSARTFDQTFTLHTTAGYDDVTGRGSPNAGFIPALASH
jgi:subtilase family serine protease